MKSPAAFPDETYPEELYRLMRENNGRAHGVYDPFRPFVGFVPAPSDATTNALRTMIEQMPPHTTGAGQVVRLTITDVEAPSNDVTRRLLYGDTMAMEVRYTHVASPDPREPHAKVAFTLWKRSGEHLVPAMPEPPAAITATVRALASQPFQVARAWASASRAARSLDAEDAAGILACVVHPPPPPEGASATDVLAWVPRVQLTTAFVLAHLALQQPWETSARRDALLSILHGPLDWSVEFVIVALTRVALEDATALLDVHRSFARLLAARPDSGHVPWETALFEQWLHLPGLYPAEREALIERYRQSREAG